MSFVIVHSQGYRPMLLILPFQGNFKYVVPARKIDSCCVLIYTFVYICIMKPESLDTYIKVNRIVTQKILFYY